MKKILHVKSAGASAVKFWQIRTRAGVRMCSTKIRRNSQFGKN